MERLRFGPETGRQIERFGSNFRMAPIHRMGTELAVGAMHIPPGGLVGYHPAVCDQLFLVVAGSGWVRTGEEGERVPVTAGDGIHWRQGEGHEAGSAEGMSVIVVEYEIPAETYRFNVAGEVWTISLSSGNPRERRALDQLQQLLQSYDLGKWAFTQRVHIESGTLPHSHPVLTLNTRHLDRDDLALATLLHEQIHWFELAQRDRSAGAIAELRERYPAVPVGGLEAAESEASTYLHLIICPLEIRAVREVLGAEAAQRVLDFWAEDHYTWIYQKVREEGPALEAILERHGLLL